MVDLDNLKTFVYKSPIGNIHCTFKDDYLIKIDLRSNDNKKEFIKNTDIMPNDDFLLLIKEFQLYFNGNLKEFSVPIKIMYGTKFDQEVWLTLREIPYGQTRTYKWLAQKVRNYKASRAVGNALRRNPLPLILPCHRVIASDGSMAGFSAGVELKRWLLRHESTYI